MATGKVASYTMETRMAIADAMVNGRDYQEIREYLEGAGMATAELPSEYSLRTFQESVEYQSVYADRRAACDLKMRAGRVAGCASARVTVLQDRVLEVFERWMDKGLMEPADMFKVLTFTLQFQRQELATLKTRAQLGDPVPPEALGPQEFSVAQMDAIMAKLAAEREAAAADAEADAGAPEHAAPAVASPASGDKQEDTGGSGRFVEEDGGSDRIPEDSEGSASISTDDAVARRSSAQDDADSASIPQDNRGFLRVAGSADGSAREAVALSVEAFRNSPSAATRQLARAKRRKRRK